MEQNYESLTLILKEQISNIICGCGLCSKECPMGNIEMKENGAGSGAMQI